MTSDSDRANVDDTRQVASHEAPSAEAGVGVYPADEIQRQAILDSVPLRDGADPDELMRELTESAVFARGLHEKQQVVPSVTQLQRRLNRLKKAYEALGDYAKCELDANLGMKLDEAIDEVLHIDNRPDCMRERGGRKRNDAAHTFILHCAGIWRRYSTRSLPRECGTHSPFYKFVMAALPQEVLASRHHTDLTETVNRALGQFYGSHPFAPANLL